MKKTVGFQDYQEALTLLTKLLKEKVEKSLLSLVLYGSVARGKAQKESDLDLLIIGKNLPSSYYERLKPILEVEKAWRKAEVYQRLLGEGFSPYLSYLIFSQEEAQENRYIFLDMVEDSLILFDKGNFFKKRLAEIKRRLKTLGAKKIYLEDGSWYWDLKPDLKLGEVFEL